MTEFSVDFLRSCRRMLSKYLKTARCSFVSYFPNSSFAVIFQFNTSFYRASLIKPKIRKFYLPNGRQSRPEKF